MAVPTPISYPALVDPQQQGSNRDKMYSLARALQTPIVVIQRLAVFQA